MQYLSLNSNFRYWTSMKLIEVNKRSTLPNLHLLTYENIDIDIAIFYQYIIDVVSKSKTWYWNITNCASMELCISWRCVPNVTVHQCTNVSICLRVASRSVHRQIRGWRDEKSVSGSRRPSSTHRQSVPQVRGVAVCQPGSAWWSWLVGWARFNVPLDTF